MLHFAESISPLRLELKNRDCKTAGSVTHRLAVLPSSLTACAKVRIVLRFVLLVESTKPKWGSGSRNSIHTLEIFESGLDSHYDRIAPSTRLSPTD
jgi:hypothetical protein